MSDKVKLNNGDLVFFKECSTSINKNDPKIRFNGGTGFAVMLGVTPPNFPPPEAVELLDLMGQAGYISFDDMIEFLGVDVGQECIKKFEAKYVPMLKEIQEDKNKMIERMQKKALLNQSGVPFGMSPTIVPPPEKKIEIVKVETETPSIEDMQ